MSASWEVANATQITCYGAATTGTLATQVADHIGGSSRDCQASPDYGRRPTLRFGDTVAPASCRCPWCLRSPSAR